MVNKCDGINCFGYLNQKRSDFILPRIGLYCKYNSGIDLIYGFNGIFPCSGP